MEDADATGVDDGNTRRTNRAGWLGAWTEIGVEGAARIELRDAEAEAEADEAIAETMVRSPKVVVMTVVKCIVICEVFWL
ncbi:hypothetical protein GB937_007713 [Aspergillus fischeri]|nr:hypothetical protein GB937_007713 [Aspergillus fischeri]